MSSIVFERALEKGASGERLNRDEVFAVASARTPDDLALIGKAAYQNRLKRFGDKAAYVFNLHINPSNICEGGCRFCAYSAKVGDSNAYSLKEEDILADVKRLKPSEVHIVGGLNHEWDYTRNLELVAELHNLYPKLHIKGFSAVEIDWFAKTEKISEEEALSGLIKAGLNALPGGGAEIFSKRIRDEFCPDKLNQKGWVRIHQTAHRLGISTNATMLTGLGESYEELVDHLMILRDAQDESGGFSCFIPLVYQPVCGEEREITPPTDHLAIIALSRLTLDNFAHVKAYWPMIGLDTAAAGLYWGADDLDGTLGEEKIAHAAGASTPKALAREQMEETIRLGGFKPFERDGVFNNRNSQI